MRFAKTFLPVLALLIAAPAVLNAQPSETADEGRAYRLLQMIVVGSANPDSQGKMSPEVRSALDELGPDLGFRAYSPVASLYGPLGSSGQAQWKLITRKLGSFGSDTMPIMSEWNLGTIERVPGDDSLVEFRRFAFQARVPARFGESVNYESIQMTLNRVRATVGKTTVIGNLPVPETGEMLFFVVKIDEIR